MQGAESGEWQTVGKDGKHADKHVLPAEEAHPPPAPRTVSGLNEGESPTPSSYQDMFYCDCLWESSALFAYPQPIE